MSSWEEGPSYCNNDDLMMWMTGGVETRLTVEAIRVEGGVIELELHL